MKDTLFNEDHSWTQEGLEIERSIMVALKKIFMEAHENNRNLMEVSGILHSSVDFARCFAVMNIQREQSRLKNESRSEIKP